jgi:hypothetical protein
VLPHCFLSRILIVFQSARADPNWTETAHRLAALSDTLQPFTSTSIDRDRREAGIAIIHQPQESLLSHGTGIGSQGNKLSPNRHGNLEPNELVCGLSRLSQPFETLELPVFFAWAAFTLSALIPLPKPNCDSRAAVRLHFSSDTEARGR